LKLKLLEQQKCIKKKYKQKKILFLTLGGIKAIKKININGGDIIRFFKAFFVNKTILNSQK